MKIDVNGDNRLGITQEVLAVLAVRDLDVSAVEVVINHIYCDVPDLRSADLKGLQAALKDVPGIHGVSEIDMLPGERRRMQLHTVFEALDVPVLAVDGEGVILQANASAGKATDRPVDRLRGARIADVLGLADIVSEMAGSGYDLPDREVTVGGQAYLLQTTPMHLRDQPDAPPGGCVIMLQSPGRLGVMLSAMQRRDVSGLDAILGEAPVMQALKQKAARVAVVDAPLLVLGETGVGKEMLARACHEVSDRRDGPFLALNCASLPEGLAESELFGYMPGAFTSASRGGKPGLLELADKGTVFLDEVGELTPYLQAKLLRFLQDGRFRRVGGAKEIGVDVRVISATNRKLEDMVAQGEFREDLFYRLNVLTLEMPPLRDRQADIPVLAGAFLERAAMQVGWTVLPKLSASAEKALVSAAWPGNVRELENVIFRAVSLTDGPTIDGMDLDIGAGHASAGAAEGHAATYAAALAAFESRLLKDLFPHYPSSRKLAKRLNVSHTTIAQKLRRYGIV